WSATRSTCGAPSRRPRRPEPTPPSGGGGRSLTSPHLRQSPRMPDEPADAAPAPGVVQHHETAEDDRRQDRAHHHEEPDGRGEKVDLDAEPDDPFHGYRRQLRVAVDAEDAPRPSSYQGKRRGESPTERPAITQLPAGIAEGYQRREFEDEAEH